MNIIKNSFLRTLGRFLFYFVVGLLVGFVIYGFPKVHAKVAYIAPTPVSAKWYYTDSFDISGRDILTINSRSNFFEFRGNESSSYYSSLNNAHFYQLQFEDFSDDKYKDFTYFYIYGYSSSIVSAASSNIGPCENIANGVGISDQYDIRTGDHEATAVGLVPFAFKCSFQSTKYLYLTLYANFITSSSTGRVDSTLYLRDAFYFDDQQSNANIEQKISEQIEEQQKTNEKMDELNDNITSSDTSDASNKANGFFEDFEDKDYGLSDVISMPLELIKNLNSAKCSPLTIPLPFVDNEITLPCMYDIYQKHFGSFLQIWQTISTGIIAYWVCINLFAMVKGFKDPESDNVEVMEL